MRLDSWFVSGWEAQAKGNSCNLLKLVFSTYSSSFKFPLLLLPELLASNMLTHAILSLPSSGSPPVEMQKSCQVTNRQVRLKATSRYKNSIIWNWQWQTETQLGWMKWSLLPSSMNLSFPVSSGAQILQTLSVRMKDAASGVTCASQGS